jgi:GntR family transcriptional regulator/MocR family aminotransferase
MKSLDDGAQNALWLTAQVLLMQRTAAIEDPAIRLCAAFFWNTALPFARDPVDQHGLPRVKPPETDVVFTTPAINARPPRRCRCRGVAPCLIKEHDDFLIVEDDS